MTFFMQEISRLVPPQSNITYLTRAAFIQLNNRIKIRVNFETGISHGRYTAILLTAINPLTGVLDKTLIRFCDVWPNNPENHIYESGYTVKDTVIWNKGRPTDAEYKALQNLIAAYIAVFSN